MIWSDHGTDQGGPTVGRRNVASFLLASLMVLATSGDLRAQNPEVGSFRIDTDLYEDSTKPPINSNLTLYHQGVFYSSDGDDGGLITVIDIGRNRILLLDRKRLKKTEVSLSEIESQIERLRAEMTPQQVELFSGTEGSRYDEAAGEISIGNAAMEYRCTLQSPSQAGIATVYSQFADWSARLNAVSGPRRPPFLRLELNAAVAAANKLPREIAMKVHHRGRTSKVTARLIYNDRLSAADETKLAKYGTMIVQFSSEPFEQFVAQLSSSAK